MLVRKLRLQRGWSQSQLADMAGVTTRTIQRIEQGNKPSLETSKALAAVFEVEFSLFQPEEPVMHNATDVTEDETAALRYAKRVKAFYEALFTYGILAAVFLVVFRQEPLVYLIFAGLGLGLIVQGLLAFEKLSFLSPHWERKLAEKRLGRKL